MPPEWMWPFPEEVEEYLETVMAKRKSGSDDDDDVAPDDEHTTHNELEDELLKGRR